MLKSIFTLFVIMSISIASIAQCSIDSVVIFSLLIDPSGSNYNFDANQDGIVNSNDEFVELCNTASVTRADVSKWRLGDDDSLPFPDYILPDNTFIDAGDCLLLVHRYCNEEDPICVVPEGVLDLEFNGNGFLGNSGDAILIADSLGVRTCTVTYGTVNCNNVDPFDLPLFDSNNCVQWGDALDGCPHLAIGDSCLYLPQILPIELSYFRVRNNDDNAVIQWQTFSEYNADYYEILWSPHIEDLHAIHWEKAQGNSAGITDYVTEYSDLVNGQNYFRLKQVDYNGDTYYSDVVSLFIKREETIDIYPTVTQSVLYINGLDSQVSYNIYNLQGQLQQTGQVNNQEVSVSLLSSGSYIIAINNQGLEEYSSIFFVE